MFLAAARALAGQVTKDDLDQGSIYPALSRIREVSARIAAAVAEVAFRRGLAAGKRPPNLLAAIRKQMYEPRYAWPRWRSAPRAHLPGALGLDAGQPRRRQATYTDCDPHPAGERSTS
jgi:hypothetical protein